MIQTEKDIASPIDSVWQHLLNAEEWTQWNKRQSFQVNALEPGEGIIFINQQEWKKEAIEIEKAEDYTLQWTGYSSIWNYREIYKLQAINTSVTRLTHEREYYGYLATILSWFGYLLIDEKQVKEEMQEHVDSMLSGVVPYIESLPKVQSVKLNKKPPALQSSISLWERTYQKTLPQDYKTFLNITDGMHLIWTSCFFQNDIVIGKINICGIEQFIPSRINSSEITHAFVLEECQPYGNTCLCFKGDQVQIWFYNYETENWLYLTDSFSNYFRLSTACLGIIGWQLYQKLPTWTLNFMCFYTPEMLEILTAKSRKIKQEKNEFINVSSEKILKILQLLNQQKKRPSSARK
ncbi:Tubulin polyglutamylase complex subunit 2 [Boothiomyces sp. JEL0866]|nr:Tubulin polyglutamylase complex subunit 2 [Boothiomyces sp. JEL0866]